MESTNKSSSKAERHGQSFYDYELAGPVSPTALRESDHQHTLLGQDQKLRLMWQCVIGDAAIH